MGVAMLGELQRDAALIHFQRGLHLERAHRMREAVAEYRRAIAFDPLLREAHDALGCYYQRIGMLAKAAEAFRAAATIDGDFLSHFHLGCVLLDMGQHESALAAFARCQAIHPDDPACSFEIGYIRLKQGAYAEAIGHLHALLGHSPADWDALQLLGCCHMRLANYDAAQDALERALGAAPQGLVQARIREQLAMIERYREFSAPRWANDLLYAEHGVAYLGSIQDDGVHLDELHDYHFTYPDIGATLRRLLAHQAAHGWAFTCAAALDRQAAPLAMALAQLLGMPLRGIDAIAPADRPLFVLAVGREAELLRIARERAPCVVVTLCLGLNWLRHSAALPEIIGVIARGACSVPWEPELRRLRCDGAPADQIEACQHAAAAQILAATHDAVADPGLAPQVAYYQQHRRLRLAVCVGGRSGRLPA